MGSVKLARYKTFQNENDQPNTAIYYKEIYQPQAQDFKVSTCSTTYSRFSCRSEGTPSYTVLNMYSTPKARGHRFNKLLALTLKEAENHALVVVGDFNAPHQAWSYITAMPKGRELWNAIQLTHMTVLNDPNYCIRIGNSVSRDTSPDLTLTRGVRKAEWR